MKKNENRKLKIVVAVLSVILLLGVVFYTATKITSNKKDAAIEEKLKKLELAAKEKEVEEKAEKTKASKEKETKEKEEAKAKEEAEVKAKEEAAKAQEESKAKEEAEAKAQEEAKVQSQQIDTNKLNENLNNARLAVDDNQMEQAKAYADAAVAIDSNNVEATALQEQLTHYMNGNSTTDLEYATSEYLIAKAVPSGYAQLKLLSNMALVQIDKINQENGKPAMGN